MFDVDAYLVMVNQLEFELIESKDILFVAFQQNNPLAKSFACLESGDFPSPVGQVLLSISILSLAFIVVFRCSLGWEEDDLY
jgi:hypothetical protein